MSYCVFFFLQSFGGGIYLKNSSQLETGVTCSSAIGGASNFAIGCKFALDKDASVRAKVDTNSQVMRTLSFLVAVRYKYYFSDRSELPAEVEGRDHRDSVQQH